MPTVWHNRTTIARRLRVSGSQLDPILTQLRLSSLLSSMDVHPAGLAPSAILCIRTLRDPLPGAVQLQHCHHSIRPPQRWEQAITASLNSLARQAARPAIGPVPPNAQAVIFADRAELLACLASDWCESSISQRWWWQSLFKDMDIARSILPAWLEAPEYIPATLHHLSVMHKVVPFVCSLSSSDAQTVLQSVIRSFALYHLAEIPSVGTHIQNLDTAVGTPTRIMPAVVQSDVSAEQPPKMPTFYAPWQPWVPESADSRLGLEQQCLLGIGLMLQRASTIVRTTVFAHAVKQWYQMQQFPAASSSAVVEMPVVGIPGWDAEDQENTIGTHIVEPPPPQDAPVTTSTSSQDVDDAISTAMQHTDIAYSTLLQDTPAIITSSMQDTGIADAIPIPTRSIYKKQSDRNELCQDSDTLFEAKVETALGGLFYLINLGLFLNLYGDFTTPLQPGIPLSIWDFVTLVGQQLLGERIQTDPVWKLLAQLADRSEQEAPGKDFEAPETWRLPVEWLRAFPEEAVWEWTAEEWRLRVRHAEGFLLLDVPLEDGSPREQLRQEMQLYGTAVGAHFIAPAWEHPTVQGAMKQGAIKCAPTVERWLDWLMPYVRSRLIRALDVHMDDLPALLCMHHANVWVTATHVDIFLSLAELPIEIRLAGLDRNPGWVPAAGRFVAFHFE